MEDLPQEGYPLRARRDGRGRRVRWSAGSPDDAGDSPWEPLSNARTRCGWARSTCPMSSSECRAGGTCTSSSTTRGRWKCARRGASAWPRRGTCCARTPSGSCGPWRACARGSRCGHAWSPAFAFLCRTSRCVSKCARARRWNCSTALGIGEAGWSAGGRCSESARRRSTKGTCARCWNPGIDGKRRGSSPRASSIFAPRLGVRPSRLTIRGQRSRWGSCSGTGTVSLNWRLMLVPEALVDYVVVHELCHLRHMNHSPQFWEMVGGEIPDYLERRRRLDDLQRRLPL